MRVVVDIECNSLNNPTKVWLIVCKDVDTGETYVFRPDTAHSFKAFAKNVTLWIGHNLLGYDLPNLVRLNYLDAMPPVELCVDTLILSKLVNYSREGGHSLESYGEEFGLGKIKFSDWTKYSQEMEVYCVRDVDITHRVFDSFHGVLSDRRWDTAIHLEHLFQLVVNGLHNSGFAFNVSKAVVLLTKVTRELGELDVQIQSAFPPRLHLVREISPKLTLHGTLNRSDFRWLKGDGATDLTEFNGGPFCRCEWVSFNPSSHKQVIDVLNRAGWKPIDKTSAHIEVERQLQRNKYTPIPQRQLDIAEQSAKMEILGKTGWKINENNLTTLLPSAPQGAKLLAKRILLEARRRTLTEWLGLVGEDGRIHGQFQGIGAWTHRMAHQRPNTANIPNDLDTQGKKKLLGKEMRSLWCAPKNRLLVGVDAEGIQLRIFAHYIDDPEFTKALVEGKKDDKTDPHSLNQRILGSVCRSRAAAKRFVYALLLGAGIWKLAQILECTETECKEALSRLLQRYEGWAALREKDIQRDATRGYFIGLDGRKVKLPGESKSERSHLCMSGYLQNGEAIIMKMATLKWLDWLKEKDSCLVNFVHDEWQTECSNDVSEAIKIASRQADSLRLVGEELGLKCPLAGSYWNDDHRDYTIGTNWSVTH